METLSLKITDDEQAILEQLTAKYECSKSEAVRRAIRLAAGGKTLQTEASSAPQFETKIDAIGETTVEILRLLQQHTQQSSESIKNTRLWAQQSMFFGKALALRFEVREQALAMMKEQLKKEEEKQNGGAK